MSDFAVANDALGDAAEIKRRMERDGYLFFRQLIEPAVVGDLRRQVLAVCRAGGWLAEGAPLAEGVANLTALCTEPEPEYFRVYNSIIKLETFNRLAAEALRELDARTMAGRSPGA